MADIIKLKIGGRYKFRNQLDPNDDNLYSQKEIIDLVRDKYNLSLEEYYNIIVHNDKSYKHICRNPECGKRLEFLGLNRGYKGTCNRKCADRYHSYHMVEITKTGVYKGTSHFIKYNSLDSTRELRREQIYLNKIDKKSKAFGSEYQSRMINYQNILARYNYDNSVDRYLYLFEFESSIKVGSTRTLKRRIDFLGNPNPVFVIKGKLEEIARYEMNILQEYVMDTLRDDEGRFTEYLPKDKLNDVINSFNKLLSNSTTIEKVIDINKEFNSEVEYIQVNGSAGHLNEMKI